MHGMAARLRWHMCAWSRKGESGIGGRPSLFVAAAWWVVLTVLHRMASSMRKMQEVSMVVVWSLPDCHGHALCWLRIEARPTCFTG